MAELDDIKTRLMAAKPGPWLIGPVSDGRERIAAPTGRYGGYLGFMDAARQRWRDEPDDVTTMSRADAEFIAHVPTDIAWLLADAEEWHEAAIKGLAEESRLRAAIETAIGHLDDGPGDRMPEDVNAAVAALREVTE